MNNYISAEMSDADLKETKELLEKLNAKLSFLVSISDEDKKAIIKMGEKSVDFVQDANLIGREHPEIYPAYFPKSEFDKDVKLLVPLLQLQVTLNELNKKLNDTITLLGSDALSASLETYGFLQVAVIAHPVLQASLDKLAPRFSAQSRARKPRNESEKK